MLDIGWNELLIVALVTILVVGPKELPHVLRTVTQFVRKMRAMASEFQSGLDDLAREAELQDLKNSIEKTASSDLAGDLEKEIDPTGEINKSVRELEAQVKEDPRKSGKVAGGADGASGDGTPAAAAKAAKAAPSPVTAGKSPATKSATSGGSRKPAAKKKKTGKTS